MAQMNDASVNKLAAAPDQNVTLADRIAEQLQTEKSCEMSEKYELSLIRPDLVVNLALPYQDLHIMDAPALLRRRIP